jgi:hypothetical protein
MGFVEKIKGLLAQADREKWKFLRQVEEMKAIGVRSYLINFQTMEAIYYGSQPPHS